MKITKIDISRLEKKDRLNLDDELKMNNLNNIVVLVGENGAGKSRLLQTILSIQGKQDDYREKRKHLQEDIDKDEKMSFLVAYDEEDEKRINQKKEEMSWLGHLKIDGLEDDDYPNIVSFIPSSSKLKDWREFPKKTWMKKAEECEKMNKNVLAEGTTAFIQKLSNQAREAEFREKNSENEDGLIKRYHNFCDLVKTNLNLKLDRNIDGDVVLLDKDGNGDVIAEVKLSEGQQLLLQICVQLYAKEALSDDYILLLDEPEVHLHPSAVIQFVEDIRKKNINGQIWIATHSLALASHFDPDDIWYVENGNIERAGRLSEKILTGLIGNDDDIEKLRQFTDMPNKFGAMHFSAQCLLAPGVVVNGKNDPQFQQIKNIVDECRSTKNKIKFLDYGAGKGRLISSFAEDGSISNEILDYYAYDKFEENKECCIGNIKKFHNEDAKSRYFNKQLGACKITFDIVLMCNVLHEIDSKDWKNVFDDVSKILKKDGFLLFVEDNIIPIGELPNRIGFLVLNTPQLEKLFRTKISQDDIRDYYDYDEKKRYKKGRLMAHLIPARVLKNVSEESIKNAIKSLKEMSQDKLLEYKDSAVNNGQTKTCKDGLEYGFWLNQFANASLCIDAWNE